MIELLALIYDCCFSQHDGNAILASPIIWVIVVDESAKPTGMLIAYDL